MDRRHHMIKNLRDGLNRSIVFFDSLTPEQLARRVYQDGARWTTQQVIAHFITIEQSMHWLFNNILSGGQGSPKDFDVDRFNKRQTEKLDDTSLDELIVKFKGVREKTIAMVETMSEKDLDRKGHHAFHGHGRLERFIRWAYEHNEVHENEIKLELGLDCDKNFRIYLPNKGS